MNRQAAKKKASAPAADERRKGVPWSEEEHRLFLQVHLAVLSHQTWRPVPTRRRS